MDLVKRTLYQTGRVKFKKPSITNYPAYVPVIVEDYPAASSPMAQMYLAEGPNFYSALAAVLRSRSESSGY